MNTNYKAFYAGLRGLTNQQVLDEIYKKMGEYCRIIEEDVPKPVETYKEKLRILFDEVAVHRSSKRFSYRKYRH